MIEALCFSSCLAAGWLGALDTSLTPRYPLRGTSLTLGIPYEGWGSRCPCPARQGGEQRGGIPLSQAPRCVCCCVWGVSSVLESLPRPPLRVVSSQAGSLHFTPRVGKRGQKVMKHIVRGPGNSGSRGQDGDGPWSCLTRFGADSGCGAFWKHCSHTLVMKIPLAWIACPDPVPSTIRSQDNSAA